MVRRTVGAALTGTYGQLTLNANGSYTYVANQDLADALDVVIGYRKFQLYCFRWKWWNRYSGHYNYNHGC